MIELIVPAALIVFGIACVIRPQQIGVAFCRFGKATWKASTFGLTDMRRFYPEEKAATTFRVIGIGFILLSLPWVFIAYSSFSGPGSFAAIRESRGYLNAHYGSANRWNLSTQPVPARADDYLVTYRYGNHTGTLRAVWQDGHYLFSEEKK
jgi:hypothetical protein